MYLEIKEALDPPGKIINGKPWYVGQKVRIPGLWIKNNSYNGTITKINTRTVTILWHNDGEPTSENIHHLGITIVAYS